MSWKTVYIDEKVYVSLELNSIKVKLDDEYITLAISDLQTVIFAHNNMTITIPLISKLIENNVGVIICNSKNDPTGLFLPFNNHSLVFKQINYQVNWKITLKKRLWKMIVKEKIKSEITVMNKVGKTKKVELMNKYLAGVKSNDITNQEGAAAKVYFRTIFGNEYFRDAPDPRNYALNYGYKILASYISKYIASRGYITQIGIFHKGSSNPFNLTYDFIEIFRYIVDVYVIYNLDKVELFTLEHKHKLVNILNNKITYDNKQYRLCNVIDKVINNYFNFLLGETETLIFPEYETIIYETA